jgi:hypothetical protein
MANLESASFVIAMCDMGGKIMMNVPMSIRFFDDNTVKVDTCWTLFCGHEAARHTKMPAEYLQRIPWTTMDIIAEHM